MLRPFSFLSGFFISVIPSCSPGPSSCFCPHPQCHAFQFLVAVTTCLRITTQRRKDPFWLRVSEVSVHGQWPLVFMPTSKRKHHCRRTWQRRTPHLMEAKKREREGEPESKEPRTMWSTCFHHFPVMPSSCDFIGGLIHSMGVGPSWSYHFPKSHQLQPSFYRMRFGDILIQNIASFLFQFPFFCFLNSSGFLFLPLW